MISTSIDSQTSENNLIFLNTGDKKFVGQLKSASALPRTVHVTVWFRHGSLVPGARTWSPVVTLLSSFSIHEKL